MEDYLKFAKELAIKAGDIMLEHFEVGVDKDIKKDGTPLTIADITINQMVIDEVQKQYPEHSILGEEASLKKDSNYTWVCDPIDGTIPYSMGIPTNMFSLALVKDGQPIVAVIYDPYQKRLYEATKGQGAKLNSKKIRVNDKPFANEYIALGGNKFGLAKTGDHLKEAFDKGSWIMCLFCLTYESMLIATGQTVATTFTGNSPWDVAAVKLIVEEAGGKVTDIYGKEQPYDKPINGAVISNGVAHEQAVNLIAKSIT